MIKQPLKTKQMKTLKQLKPYFTAFIFLYVSIVFITKEINPFIWSVEQRTMFVLLYFFTLFVKNLIKSLKQH